MTLDPARRAGLERARASSIARDHFGLDPESSSIDAAPFGAVIAASGRAVIVSSSDDLSVLGGVLVWATRNADVAIDLVVEHHAGIHARRAAVVAPAMSVHEMRDGAIQPSAPAPIDDPHPTPDDVVGLIAMIERSGADAVIEDGIVRAEVAGLEVGRVVTGPAGSVLEVGVGRFDREAGALLHADRPIEPTLAATIEQVRGHRQAGSASHAVNRIARSRWLRSLILVDPSLVSVHGVELVEPVPPRTTLLEDRPAALLGTSESGTRCLIVCTVGVDLGVVPEIIDLLAATGADEVRVAAPARDRLPFLDALLARLPVPAGFVPIEVPWAG